MRTYSSLTDAVALLKREDGSHVVPIQYYYEKFIAPIGARYAIAIPSVGGSKGVCPLHDDIAPSLGILNGRDGRERFNCFGCKEFGHVVDLHRKVEALHHRRYMSNNDAALDLLLKVGIDPKPLQDVVDGSDSIFNEEEKLSKQAKRRKDARALQSKYSLADYRRDIINGIVLGEDVSYFNTLVHRMTYKANNDG